LASLEFFAGPEPVQPWFSAHMPSDMYIIIAMISDMMANPQNARFDECITLYRIFVVPISLRSAMRLLRGRV